MARERESATTPEQDHDESDKPNGQVEVRPDIFVAAQYGDHDRVAELLGLDGEAAGRANEHGATPLHWAAMNGRLPVCQLLLSRGADPNVLGGDLRASPLMWAAKGGQVAAVQLLLEAGGDATLRDGQGFDLLLLAVHSRSIFLILLLLQDDIDIETVDDEGHTPLMWSCYQRDAAATRLLLRCGADVHRRDKHQLTALHWAAVGGEENCIRAVLEEGADLSAEQDEGLTPAGLARKLKNQHALETSLEKLDRDPDTGLPTGWRVARTTSRRVIFVAPSFLLPIMLLLLARAPIFLAVPCVALLLYGSARLLTELCNPGPDRYRGLSETPFFAGIFSASAFWTAVHWATRVLRTTWAEAPVLNLVFGSVFGAAMYNYFRAMSGDPGFAARSTSRSGLRDTVRDLIRRGTLDQRHFCLVCLAARPHRARHCRLCDRCVIKQDHHCPWLATCVGERNHPAFLLYVLGLGIGIPMYLWLQSIHIDLSPASRLDTSTPCTLLAESICTVLAKDAFGNLLAIWDLLQLSWVYVLITVQLFQISRGVTTQELFHLRKDRQNGSAEALFHQDESHAHSCPRHQAGTTSSGRSMLSRAMRIVGIEQALLLFSGKSKRVRVVNPYNRGVRRNCTTFWNMTGSSIDTGTHEQELV